MKAIAFLSILLLGHLLVAQGVSVNENNTPPDPSVIVDNSSTAKAMPRMTMAQRDTIVEAPNVGSTNGNKQQAIIEAQKQLLIAKDSIIEKQQAMIDALIEGYIDHEVRLTAVERQKTK